MFRDLLKKAVDDAVQKGIQQGVIKRQKTSEELEAERMAAEKKLQEEKAAEALERQNELKKVLQPTCEKGDCLWYNEKFYFTCPKECACERKIHTKKDWGCEITHPEFWRYMKQLENKNYFIRNDESIHKEFMMEFLPQYGKGNWGIARNFVLRGLTEDSPFFPIYLAIKDAPALEYPIGQQIEYCGGGLREQWQAIYREPFCKNISLYSRSLEEFQYTVKAFAMVLDKANLSEHFKDISDIDVEQLYDSNGKIKPAGLGGPKKGHYGDTIWNTIESWSGENGENNT